MKPQAWPGVNCVEAPTRGKKLLGIWYDRTKKKIKQGKAPLFHCSAPDKWRAYRDNYRWFVGRIREGF